MRRQRLNSYLSPELLQQIGDFAARRRLSKSSIMEAAVAEFLSDRSADSREAAIVRRLDLLTRQVQRLERTNRVTMETLALFVRFFLTVTPPLPPDVQASARAKGQQRYEGFVEALGRRLQKGQSFLNEIPEDVDNEPSHGARDDGLGAAS
jgi:hypothetical protein